MQIILDVFWIKRFEKDSNIRLTEHQLNQAREQKGIVEVTVGKKIYAIKIPYLSYPNDLMTNSEQYNPEVQPWDIA